MGLKFSLIKNEKGQGIVEFALIIPIFLLLTLGAIDYGYMLHKQHLLTQLTRETARVSSTVQGNANVQTRVDGLVTSYFATGDTVTITYDPPLTNRVKGERFNVTATYTYKPFSPGFAMSGPVDLKSTSSTRIEVLPLP